MKISKPIAQSTQLFLFDYEIDRPLIVDGKYSMGRARAIAGAFFEGLTVGALGGCRHRTDSRCDYCPDVSIGNEYFEVKGAGLSGEFLIYKGRLEKDATFAKHHPLTYIVWSHGADFLKATCEIGLKALIQASLKGYYRIPFDVLHAKAMTVTPTKLNSAYGHSDTNPIYGEGYRMKLVWFGEYFNEFN